MVSTPSQDYDDSYCISYARQHDAFIVSNDKFRDYIKKLQTNPNTNEAETIKKQDTWLQQHCVSFTFKGDEFLPNPDSKLFTKFHHETYKQIKLEEIEEEFKN